MPFSGTETEVSSAACDGLGNVTLQTRTVTWVAGMQQSNPILGSSTFTCACCQTCICCCVLPDAGGSNQCCGVLNETVAGDCVNPAAGNLCPGSALGCDQCLHPHFRTKTCLSGVGTSCSQIKIPLNLICSCTGVNCGLLSGNCQYTCFTFCCAIPPIGGC